MRVLQLIQKPQRRGAEVFAMQLSDALCGIGNEGRVVALYENSDVATRPTNGVDHCFEAREAHALESALGFQPSLLAALRREIREYRPDIVQVNGARTLKYGAVARMLGGDEGWRLIYRNIGAPGEWTRGARRQLAYRWIMARMDGMVALTTENARRLRANWHYTGPMRAIANGVDIGALTPAVPRAELRRRMDVAIDAPVVLFAGSLTPEKAVDRLLRVFADVQKRLPAARLWIAGDGALREDLERLARDLEIDDAVRFLGTVADIGSYMAAADVFALVSSTEGIPGTLLEAGALGVPVVATDVGGVSTCVQDGETGFLRAPADEAGLAAAIVQLLSDRDLRTRMGSAARARMEREFAIEHIARSYVDFYEEVRRASTRSSTA